MSYILAIEHSVDLMIAKLCQPLLTTDCQGVPKVVLNVLSAARYKSNIHSATFHITIFDPFMSPVGIPYLNHYLFKINIWA